MDAADSRFDYLSCADGTWGNELHGVLTPEIKKSPLGNGRGFLFAVKFEDFAFCFFSFSIRADIEATSIGSS